MTIQRWTVLALAGYLGITFLVVFVIKPDDLSPAEAVIGFLHQSQENNLLMGIRYGHIEAAANVLFFIPLGILLPLVFSPPRFIVGWLCAALLSIGIELIQFVFLSSRVGSLRDIACNTLGAALGVLLIFLTTRIRMRQVSRVLG